jgi:hypothetical protein
MREERRPSFDRDTHAFSTTALFCSFGTATFSIARASLVTCSCW